MKNLFSRITIFALLFVLTLGIVTAPTYASKNVTGKIDIGGYSLFIDVEGKGKPTVVFESGYGEGTEAWSKVQPEVAKFAKTVVYDRGALGQSDVSPKPRDAEGIAKDLHTLLQAAKVKPPYILVGHSMGGFNVRMFQSLYPNEVQGLVLVDPTPDDILVNGKLPFTQDEYTDMMIEGLNANPTLGTWNDYLTSSQEAYDARPNLKHVPLTVLVAPGRASQHSSEEAHWDAEFYLDGFEQNWQTHQQDLVSQSQKGKYILTEDTGHRIQEEQPQYVIDAVKDMILTIK